MNHPEDVVWKAIELAESGTGNVLGLKARKLVEQYSWDNIADQFEKIIDESVKKRGN